MSKQVHYSLAPGVIKEKVNKFKKTVISIAAATVITAGFAAPAFAAGNGADSSTLPFHSAGKGTETSLSAAGCQSTQDGCTVESDGTAISSHIGKGSYVSTLTIDYSRYTLNGQGGYCATASGPSTITAANGDTVTLKDKGTVCEVGATGNNVAHTFNGTYSITGGTGRFANATGNGTVTGGDDGAGNSNYSLSGTIAY